MFFWSQPKCHLLSKIWLLYHLSKWSTSPRVTLSNYPVLFQCCDDHYLESHFLACLFVVFLPTIEYQLHDNMDFISDLYHGFRTVPSMLGAQWTNEWMKANLQFPNYFWCTTIQRYSHPDRPTYLGYIKARRTKLSHQPLSDCGEQEITGLAESLVPGTNIYSRNVLGICSSFYAYALVLPSSLSLPALCLQGSAENLTRLGRSNIVGIMET